MYGKKISGLRIQKKMTQRELAENLKVSKSSISMYEQEKREPDINLLIDLSTFFDVSVDYLLGLTNEQGSFKKSLIVSDEKEQEIVAIYRQLNNDGQCELRGLIKGFFIGFSKER